MKLRYLLTVGAALHSLALAADPGLLSLIPPDSKAVAGIEVAQARTSPFGQYLLSHMPSNGFNPSQNLSEIVVATDGAPKAPSNHWLMAGTGAFDIPKLTAAAEAGGGTVSSFKGVDIVTRPAGQAEQLPTAIAFLGSSTGIMGDPASVQAAIQQWQNKAAPNNALLGKVNQVSGNQDFWFVTLVPVSDLTAALPPGTNLGRSNAANVLAGVNQLSGGVHFGSTVTLSAEAVARSDKDAQALADVVRFAASVVELNRQNNPMAGQLAAVLDTLDAKTSGNLATFSLAVPEQQLEQLLPNGGPASSHTRRKVLPQVK